MNTLSLKTLLGGFIAVMLLAASADAGNLTVNAASDDGTGTCTATKCTLRDAILTATSGRTIDFSLPANSTITLTNGQLFIDKNLNIVGPGANLLSIQRSSADGTPTFHIFNVNGSFLSVSGVMISNGLTSGADNDRGGGIYNNGGTLVVTGCAITGNNGAGGNGSGGGVYSSGTTTISNSLISGNGTGTSGNGGGVFNASGTMTINNCTFTGNFANNGGALSNLSGSTVTITNSTVASNSSRGLGGGIYIEGTLNMESTIVANNTAIQGPDISGTITSQGYNLIRNTSNATISGTTAGNQLGVDPVLDTLQDNGGPTPTFALRTNSPAINSASSAGSTTDQRGFARPVYVQGATFPSGGDGSNIGAFEVQPSQLSGCSEINLVVNNTNDSGAGSLRSVIANACFGSTVSFATSVTGTIFLTTGQIVIDKNLTINGPGANLLNVERDPSVATGRIFNIASSRNVTIIGLTISNGTAPGDRGGGILNSGTLTLFNDTVSLNSAIGGNGGGIYNSGTLAIYGSTISGNEIDSSTPGSGGAIFNFGATITITNSTLSGNSASSPGHTSDHGGAVFSNVGSVTILSCTIAGNSSDNGGGLMGVNGAVIKAQNTIIALNTSTTSASGPDVNGPLSSQGFNIFGDPSGMTLTGVSQQSDQRSVTADQLKLGPLQDNGGATFTRALIPGSVAIDKGYYSGLNTDQRGFTRPVDMPDIANYAFGGDGADIGAFELQAPPTPTATPTATPTPQPTPTPTPASQLLNLSTRKQVGTSDNVLIGGFIVTGTEDKKVLVRGLGPSLGIDGALADPTLEIHAADSTLLAQNNNWKDTQEAEIIATGIPPTSDLESAIITTLAAKPVANGGAGYTAILAGSGGGTGIGLLEIYDINTAANSKLANISTRGAVGIGNDLLIGGFIPGPLDHANIKVLVRALGPSLTAQSVANPLQDPLLELHDGNGTLLQSNDNWKETQQAEIEATGAPPSDDRESALIAILPPNNKGYTAVVRGVGDTTGVALVEVFGLN